MKKALIIGLKDVRLAFRDRAALILMLAAPFVLTLGMGFVSGRFSGGSRSGLAEIPVVIVNQDEGQLGGLLLEVFQSNELADLVAPSTSADVTAARQQVEADEAAAAVIVPARFSDSLIPSSLTGQSGAPVAIEVYANPARPTGAAAVQAIVEVFLSEVETGRVGGQVVITQLLEHGLVSAQQRNELSQIVGNWIGQQADVGDLITLRRQAAPGEEAEFDVLAFFAPGMAMLFLMYTVSQGGRSILVERSQGTLARLLATPTGLAQVLGGKVLGIFLTGAAQVGILILGTSLMFGLQWGDPLGVAALIVAVAAAATGWGMLLAAFAQTPAQVGSLGAALMLLFGILSGAFVPADSFPGWLRLLAKLTPNAWGLDGFVALADGGTLASIGLTLAALAAMAVVLFGLAVVAARANGGWALR